jgi:hypothetical protein
MEKSITGVEKPISAPGCTIIPVWKMTLRYSYSAGIMIFGTKKAVAAVIIGPNSKIVFGIDSEEIPLDQLMLEVPALRGVLEDAQK